MAEIRERASASECCPKVSFASLSRWRTGPEGQCVDPSAPTKYGGTTPLPWDVDATREEADRQARNPSRCVRSPRRGRRPVPRDALKGDCADGGGPAHGRACARPPHDDGNGCARRRRAALRVVVMPVAAAVGVLVLHRSMLMKMPLGVVQVDARREERPGECGRHSVLAERPGDHDPDEGTDCKKSSRSVPRHGVAGPGGRIADSTGPDGAAREERGSSPAGAVSGDRGGSSPAYALSGDRSGSSSRRAPG